MNVLIKAGSLNAPGGVATAKVAAAAQVSAIAQDAATDLDAIRDRASTTENAAGGSQRIVDLLQGRKTAPGSDAAVVAAPVGNAASGLAKAALSGRGTGLAVRPPSTTAADAKPRWKTGRVAVIAVTLAAVAIYGLLASPSVAAGALLSVGVIGSLGVVSLRRPSFNERQKIDTARSWARQASATARALDEEFSMKGGSFQIDDNRGGGYFGTAVGNSPNPTIALTWDLLWRVIQRQYKGAPWEFIASVIAREQVLSTDWYADIPVSADKLSAAYMNMVRVFVELTNSSAKPDGWATDKDFRATPHDKSWVIWGWYGQLVAAARSAAAGTQHINETEFFKWVADYAAQQAASNPAYQFSLWELYDGKYYRPGDARNGQAIPAHIPRIDRATFDRASQKVYGADGKGGNSEQNTFGWMIQWLRSRGEI